MLRKRSNIEETGIITMNKEVKRLFTGVVKEKSFSNNIENLINVPSSPSHGTKCAPNI